MNGRDHDRLISCRDYILAGLTSEMDDRAKHKDWIDRERFATANAANEWALANPPASTVTLEAVEQAEPMAVGHVDYAHKLALYVAERVLLETETS